MRSEPLSDGDQAEDTAQVDAYHDMPAVAPLVEKDPHQHSAAATSPAALHPGSEKSRKNSAGANAATSPDRDLEAGGALLRQHSKAETPAWLAWKDLTVTAETKKGKKVVLNGVQGYVEPKHMLAIMGPTGCGKSTLMDSLAGRLQANVKCEGGVFLNGNRSSLSYGAAAYVPQQDLLIGTLTVRETITYSAMLRLDSSKTKAEKLAIVSEVISSLGLTEAVDVPIGNWHTRGISGGQKRRVSIGCELVTSPSLLFLDEPTSGLDAAAAFYVMSAVREQALQGRTIVSVIHQPSSETFELFDQLCLLASGELLYFGAASAAASVFASAGLPCPQQRNPSDHFLMMINADFEGSTALASNVKDDELMSSMDCIGCPKPGSVAESRKAISAANKASAGWKRVEAKVAELSSPSGMAPYAVPSNEVNWFVQTALLTKRSFQNSYRNIGVFWMRALMYVMLCLCIGTLYFQMGKSWDEVFARSAMMFFVSAFLTFMSIAAFPAFAEVMEVFIRERLNNYYGVSQFAVADFLAGAPFLFLIALLSGISGYFLAGLNTDGDRFPYFVINLFLALTTTESLMVAIAAVVPHYLMGIALGAGAMGLNMLVCGFFVPLGSLPAPVWKYPLHYVSLHTYGLTGFMNNEFKDTDGWACPCTLTNSCPTDDCTITGSEVLKAFDFVERNKWIDVLVQIGMIVVFRAFFLGMLKAKEHMSK